jgi:purine-nucleoside/S-methyl-5'-thioadenosine phosphorylase / adenosine deaminase
LASNDLPLEQFPALNRAGFTHAFVRRVPGVDVSYDKGDVLARLDDVHRQVRGSLGLERTVFLTAQQVHGNRIAAIEVLPDSDQCFAECDGLITNQRGVCLGIYVADCCAVYLVDPIRACIGLVHSGKKGTELAIVPEAIAGLTKRFGSNPADLVVQLSPCIRSPHYEVDFAAEIVKQCRESGIRNVHDCGICTACDLEHYYSYRAEKGRTGRMLALLGLSS